MTTFGKTLIAISIVAQLFFIAVAGGLFGNPGAANMPAVIMICTFLLSLVIIGSRP